MPAVMGERTVLHHQLHWCCGAAIESTREKGGGALPFKELLLSQVSGRSARGEVHGKIQV